MRNVRTLITCLIMIASALLGTRVLSKTEPSDIHKYFGHPNVRPLSLEWLELWRTMPGDDVERSLATELISSPSSEKDAWAERTYDEVQTALRTDDQLNRNRWHSFRCSKNGCIVAMEMPESEDDGKRLFLYNARLLGYLTPRPPFSHHEDLRQEEYADTQRASGEGHWLHYILFIFPPTSPARQMGPHETEVISASVAPEVKSAVDALTARNWFDALVHLNSAEHEMYLTDYDLYKIYELRGYANIHLLHYEDAQQAYTRALSFAFNSSVEDTSEIAGHLLELAVINDRPLQVIEIGRYLEGMHAASDKQLASISDSYFKLFDCKNAMAWAEKSFSASERNRSAHEIVASNVASECQRFHLLLNANSLAQKIPIAF